METKALSIEEERAKLAEEWEKLRLEKEKFAKYRRESGVEVKLFVGNLDPETTEDGLTSHFSAYGEIKEVVLLKDRSGKSKRSGFVKYYTEVDADAAIAAIHDHITDGSASSPMVVRVARPKTQISGPSGNGADSDSFGRYNARMGRPSHRMGMMGSAMAPNRMDMTGGGMAPSMGGMGMGMDMRMGMGMGNAPGMASMGPGMMRPMHDPMASRNMVLGYRGPIPMTSQSNGRSWQKGPSGANIYVNNMDVGAQEMDLRRRFASFGNIVSCKAFSDKGYGFVSFDNPQSAQLAIQSVDGTRTPGGRVYSVSLKAAKGEKGKRFSPY